MEIDCATTTVQQIDFAVNELVEQLSALSLCGGDEQKDSLKPEKDPRTIARKYQMEVCKRGLEENIVVCLGTGAGKTHIAVLIMYEMRHLFKNPQKSICIFLAPTIALVHQQAKVIEKSVDFKVGIYCGHIKRGWSHEHWEQEIEEYETSINHNKNMGVLITTG
ncbi:dicer-like 4 [Perilla frutescens var. hirtella]|nr:dicer-like 4 [Perilla frutescens var. hirtella]KAH6817386.1 dicer-like 4 [Perilla frutescens var. frutescens]